MRSKPADFLSRAVKTGILILMSSYFVLFFPLPLLQQSLCFWLQQGLAHNVSLSTSKIVCASEDLEGFSLPLLEGLQKSDSELSVHRNGAVWLTLHRITENRAEEQILPCFSISPKEVYFLQVCWRKHILGMGQNVLKSYLPRNSFV